jgi:hypothetical protein
MAQGDPDKGGLNAGAGLVPGAGRRAGHRDEEIADAEDGTDGQRP